MTKITIDRAIVEQGLEALDVAASCIDGYYVPRGKTTLPEIEKAQNALRAALAQQQAGSWQDGVLEGHLRERERWLAQEQAEPRGGCNLPPLQAEPDLSRCPQCNGPADNGHDRSIPPHPYLCTKCMAELPQPSYNVTVVDDAHPNGIPLEQWQNKPAAWRCACGANLFIDADGAPRSKAESVEPVAAHQFRSSPLPGCNRGNRCPWTDESKANGWRSTCRHCGLHAQGSGQ
jgi:hypothetical protein